MITNCVCVIPGIFCMLSRNNKESKRLAKTIVDVVAILAQLSACFLWLGLDGVIKGGELHKYLLPVSLFLTSFGWWENYVDKRSPIGNNLSTSSYLLA